MNPESASLSYRGGSSDKVYHVQLESKDDGWVVNFQYGRRGNTLQAGTKTSSPTAYDKAKKIFDKLVQEKKSGGYTESGEGTPYQGTDKANRMTGLIPQLLNPIEEDEADRYIEDNDWMMQEKKDGTHMLARCQNGEVECINRLGLTVSRSEKIVNGLKALVGTSPGNTILTILDGEAIGDVYWVFDLLQASLTDYRTRPAIERLRALAPGFRNFPNDYSVRLLPTWVSTEDKRQAFEDLKKRRAEGVVFKKKSALYTPGRPHSGGDMVKLKFWSSATCRVVKRNDKRSVALGMGELGLCKDSAVPVGNVTIPASYEIPKVGALVEVKYLYAYKGGSLYQPQYKGLREDKVVADLYDSLKLKATPEEEDAQT